MADVLSRQACSGLNIDDICGVEKGIDCIMCHSLKLELESALQELSSARKIIQILQDDGNNGSDFSTVIQGEHQVVTDSLQNVSSQNDNDGVRQVSRRQKSNINSKGLKIPTIVNGKIVNSEVINSTKLEDKSNRTPRNKNLKLRHKVLIIGDSHLKSNTDNMEQFLNTKVAVCSLIKPGAPINQILSGQEKELKDPSKKDVIVISGGSNDIDNNCKKGNEVLLKMTKFTQSYNNTKIVIMSIPHRYDLVNDSRVNVAIQKF